MYEGNAMGRAVPHLDPSDVAALAADPDVYARVAVQDDRHRRVKC